MKIAILLLTSLLMISCKSTAAGCTTFHQIPELSAEKKQSLKQADMPREWVKAIADFRQTYKEICE